MAGTARKPYKTRVSESAVPGRTGRIVSAAGAKKYAFGAADRPTGTRRTRAQGRCLQVLATSAPVPAFSSATVGGFSLVVQLPRLGAFSINVCRTGVP
jgi:hypothetical protein